METIVQWSSILSTIIAVIALVIAIWASRSSAKASARQIAAVEEGNAKEIESIKRFAKTQIEVSLMQIEKELGEANARAQQTARKISERQRQEEAAYQLGGSFPQAMWSSQNEQKSLADSHSYHTQQIVKLNQLQSQLLEMRKQFEEE